MFALISSIGLVGTLLAIAGHYLLFGPRHKDLPDEPATVDRMGALERLLHGCLIFGFLPLALTGFIAVIGQGAPLRGWLRVIHIACAPLFVVGLAAAALRWATTCRFFSYDWEWVKVMGGYLWGDQEAPAGKFNAGQKAFFWAILALGLVVGLSGLGRAFPLLDEFGQAVLYELHRYSSLGLLLAVLSHIYLGTLANPGTVQVIFTGRVRPTWAKHHHPIWWEEIDEKKTPSP